MAEEPKKQEEITADLTKPIGPADAIVAFHKLQPKTEEEKRLILQMLGLTGAR